MTSTTTNSISKVAALAAGFAVVAMMAAIAPAAHADTAMTPSTTTTTTSTAASNAALMAQIASLQAQLAASQGTSMMTSSTLYVRDLTIGARGTDVTSLQTWLMSKGFSIPAGATGYFGSQTRSALAAYQAANGISPAVGYFGPITRAHVNSGASSSTTTTTTTTTTVAGCAAGAMFSSTTGQSCGVTSTTTGGTTVLSGGEGTINNFQTIGASNVTLGTGATQQVYGFQFMAGGSDLLVDRIYYDVANTTTTGTTRPWNIFQTATLTDASGKTVATVNASNQSSWSEDGTLTNNGNQVYRLAFSGINNVVKLNATQTYFLSLTTASAYATGNVGGTYGVGLASQGLRATDAMGIQQYIGSGIGSTGTAQSTVLTNSSTSGTVTISTGSDNPQTTTLMANQNNTTQNVVLNTFTLQNQGSSNVELYTLPVTLITSSTTSSNLVQSLMLYQGSTLLDTESPTSSFTSGSVLTFKNLTAMIPSGTTSSFRVVATIQAVGGSNPAPSQSYAQVNVLPAGVDVENPGGAIITPTGSSTGYPISFAINGLSIASSPTTVTANSVLASAGSGTAQTGTFTFTFNVTSFGQSIYVPATASAVAVTLLDQQLGSAATTSGVGISSTANRSALGNYVVYSGQTAAFTVTVAKTAGSGHFFDAILTGLYYGTTDAAPTAASTTLPSTYTTPSVQINS